jgi:hypothetical protein
MADVEMMSEDERPDFLDYLPAEREDSTQEGVLGAVLTYSEARVCPRPLS